MKKNLLFAIIGSIFLIGCDNLRSLHSPSAPDSFDSDNLSAWKPCVGVQNPGYKGSPELIHQMDAVRRLHKAGRMEWIRLGGANLRGEGRDYGLEAKAMGLKVFGIITQEDLESGRSWEDVFDQMVSTHPAVDVWEIAGEISNVGINPVPMTPEYYMPRFRNLVKYARDRYPQLTLASAPTIGSKGGPEELQKFIELGLLDIDAIVTVNIYLETAFQEYATIFDRNAAKMARRRIWVTETGASPVTRHIDWVRNFYPRIINSLRPEMICWYILYGEEGNQLLQNIDKPPIRENPLFQRLVGGVQ